MKTQDMIVNHCFQPHKPHQDILRLGYRFICSHISESALIDSDADLPTNAHELFPVQQENGVNFYVKEK